MSTERLRGVFDNNVLISSTLLGGIPRRAFDKFLDDGIILISTSVILEMAEVLNRQKFDRYVTYEERMRFMVSFLKVAELIDVTERFNVCRDPKDNKLLELAVCGNADLIITGDKDLLEINPFQNIEIITPKDFLLRK